MFDSDVAGGPEPSGPIEYGSDIAVEVLRDLGVEYLALNPGASYRGLHDSIVNYGKPDGENGDPAIIECTAENIAVAVAHGYAKATGRPMGVVLHDVVGLQNGSMSIFNAWCDRAPVLILGGGGPMAAEERRPWIDWIHTALVQGNLVRDFVKWDDQPASHLAIIESLVRGARIAATQPQGPVYICLDAGLMEAPVPAEDPARDTAIVTARRRRMGDAAVPPAADRTALATVASALRDARWPVLVTGRTGRSDAAFHALSSMARRWAFPVIDLGDRLSLPTSHEMNLTAAPKSEVLGRADAVVFLDAKDLTGPLMEIDRTARTKKPILPPESRVFSLGLEDYAARGWIADYQGLYPTELCILADTALALPMLDELLGDPGPDIGGRHDEIVAWHARARQAAEETARRRGAEQPIALPALAAALRIALEGESCLVANGELGGWARKLIDIDQPRQHLGSNGGGGLGYGIGATIGASLACVGSQRFVVDLQGDGDLMMAPGGLWTLARYSLPALIVMNNNRSYYNDEEHQINLAHARGRAVERSGIGTRIESPPIDFARLAESQGVEGIGPIDDPDRLMAALTKGVAIVRDERRPALIDVVTQAQPR